MFPIAIQNEVTQFRHSINNLSEKELKDLAAELYGQRRTNEYLTNLWMDDMIREGEFTQRYVEMLDNARAKAGQESWKE